MRKLRLSLTTRIFLITSALLIAACAITYATIALLTPITYTSMLSGELASKGDSLVDQLARVMPGESPALLDDFARQTSAEIYLVDDMGRVLYDNMPSYGAVAAEYEEGVTVITDSAEASHAAVSGSATLMNDAQEATVVQEAAGGGMYTFAFADGTGAHLSLYGGTHAVNQATEAMWRVLPLLAAIIFVISLAGSYFYAWLITRPIVSIAQIAGRMAALDFGARWTGRRSDEIGELGTSLNLLSDNLSTTLEDLRQANSELRSDMERERELERQRMAFFSAASHELKTPITILKGQLGGMLARVGVYEDRDKYLARALGVTGRMESLVEEILTINRLGAAGFELRRAPVDLSQLMRDQVQFASELLEQRALRIRASIEDGVTVTGDAALLSKVLGSVLLNAILYSPPGALIDVSVTGRGFSLVNSDSSIPEEAIGQLFTPFYRVEQSRNRKSGGSGLGLYLVRTILELHGASCHIKNTPEGVLFAAVFDA